MASFRRALESSGLIDAAVFGVVGGAIWLVLFVYDVELAHDPTFISLLAAVLILVSIGGRRLLLFIIATGYFPFALRRHHYDDVRSRVDRMPFRIRAQGRAASLIRSTFVDIDISPSNLPTFLKTGRLVPLPSAVHDADHQNYIVRDRRTLIVLASAGSGKTTFIRRHLLAYVDGTFDSRFFVEGSHFVPIYIQMKLLDNTAPYPIFRYICKEFRLFGGRRGLRRLLKYGRSHVLFLALDGYDEIQLGRAEERSYIEEELDYICGDGGDRLYRLEDAPTQFYEAMRRCHVWISARPEFFRDHQLRLTGLRLEETGLVALKGLGDRRLELITKLFATQPDGTRLDAEEFLWNLDISSEDTLKPLSLNPLFLTMICQVFLVSAKATFAFDQPTLVLAYITLLVEGLDKSKVSDISAEEKPLGPGFETRRSAWPQEKIHFLKYFAAQLFAESLTVFTYEDLNRHAIGFLEESDSVAESIRKQILTSLDDRVRGFCAQLVRSGVIWQDSKSKGGVFFDFPHQAFRDSLASAYVDGSNENDRLQWIFERRERAQVRELLFVCFQLSSKRGTFLRTMFRRAFEEPEDPSFGQLLVGCLRRCPRGYEPTDVVEDALEMCIAQNAVPLIDAELFNLIRFREEFIGRVTRQIPSMFRQGKWVSLELCMAVIGRQSPDSLVLYLDTALEAGLSNAASSAVFMKWSLRLSRDALVARIAAIRGDARMFRDFCYLATTQLNRNDWRQLSDRIAGDWTVAEKSIMCWFQRAYGPESWGVSSVDEIVLSWPHWDVYQAVVKTIQERRVSKEPQLDPAVALVVTKRIAEEIPQRKRHEMEAVLTVGRAYAPDELQTRGLPLDLLQLLKDRCERERHLYGDIVDTIAGLTYEGPTWSGLLK
jgi:hypothetical protein